MIAELFDQKIDENLSDVYPLPASLLFTFLFHYSIVFFISQKDIVGSETRLGIVPTTSSKEDAG